MQLNHKESTVLTIGNAGTGITLDLMIFKNKKISGDNLKKFVNEAKSGLDSVVTIFLPI